MSLERFCELCLRTYATWLVCEAQLVVGQCHRRVMLCPSCTRYLEQAIYAVFHPPVVTVPSEKADA